MTRVRQSLEYIQHLYTSGEDKKPLETLVRAFHEMQKRDPSDPDSWFAISAWHGEPFRGPGQTDSGWWGGYCNHGNVLFPTWHRALLYRLEEAMRRMPGCGDVTLPFWDEYTALPPKPQQDDYNNWNVIPLILTTPKFTLDGVRIDNPLYSYTLQRDLSQAKLQNSQDRYTKHAGYSTVRFPLSGLVGTQEVRNSTELYNAQYQYPLNTQILNRNVANWLEGQVVITKQTGTEQEKQTTIADTTSLLKRLKLCLKAPNYTVFSNTTSQNQWINDNNQQGKDPLYVVSLESPHNGMHLALGGIYQLGSYDADPDGYKNANGDMGCNETASFDPIFYLHHCFIDYMFWKWQELHNCTNKGELSVIEGYPGTIVVEGAPVGYPRGSLLDMTSSLFPFRKPDGQYFNSHDVTDIRELGYTYGKGSIDAELATLPRSGGARGGPRGPILTTPEVPIAALKRVHNIDRTEFNGSFVIKTYAIGPGMEEPVLVGSEPILSRWNVEGCANCQSHLKAEAFVPVDQKLMEMLVGESGEEGIKEVQYFTVIQTSKGDVVDSRGSLPHGGPRGGPRAPKMPEEPGKKYRTPIIDDLY